MSRCVEAGRREGRRWRRVQARRQRAGSPERAELRELGAPGSPRGVWLGGLLQAWLPLAGRALTLGITLLGLAGIGVAASRGPQFEEIAERGAVEGAALLGAGTWLAPVAGFESVNRSNRPSGTHSGADAEPARRRPAAGAARSAERRSSRAERASGPPAPLAAADGAKQARRLVVDINRATAVQLTALPGIGRKRAAQIVALRRRLGRFRRVTDLLRVKGIGVKSLRKLLPHVTVGPPPEGRGRGADAGAG